MASPRTLVVLFLALLAPPASAAKFSYREDFAAFTKNVTFTLDSLLSNNYDKKIRPGIGGPPTQVGVNMYIKSLGPVSENEAMYTMDVYFRQTWYDDRLRFDFPGLEEFSMSWLFLDKVWKPDTFFINGKKSYLHKITSPNRFLRMRKDGFLMYSMRLTISASCPMHLRKFPLDSQNCPLIIGSYGYTSQDLVYRWTSTEGAVGLEPGLEMAQYDLTNINVSGTLIATRNKEEYSVIRVIFHLRRSTGYFLLQIYVPCCLIVVSSWVSFWINPTDAAGRVSLAVTTVLSITTMGIGGRAQLPKVSYATAMDYFIIFCFSFAFAVAVEYAMINFMDKLKTDIRRILEERRRRKKSLDEKTKAPEPPSVKVDEAASTTEEYPEPAESSVDMAVVEEEKWEEGRRRQLLQPRRWYSVPSVLECDDTISHIDWTRPPTSTESGTEPPTEESWGYTFRRTLGKPYRMWRSVRLLPREEDVDIDEAPVHKFTKIDIAARKLFPMSFSLFLVTYTFMYSFYITDIVPGENDPDPLNI